MRIRRNRDNKIKIPWYSRRVRTRLGDDVEPVTPAQFGFRFPVRPTPAPVAEPVRQPATEPVMEPGRVPVRVPDPSLQPVPVPDPLPLPGLPGVPIPRRQPAPETEPPRFPFPQPEPFPQLPQLPVYQQTYDWEAHFRRLAEEYERTAQGSRQAEPVPASENPFSEALKRVLQPIIYLMVGREILNQYVRANVTDPIYSKMLEDPVLGAALREAEKANLDMEALGNYFAQYDWDNFDAEQMLIELTALVGAAGAARIIVFFIGRRVVFRM